MFHFGTNHANGGTASCRSAVFFGSEEEGKRTKRTGTGIGEDGRGLGGCERTWRGRKRTKRTEEDGEDFARRNQDFDEVKTGLGERRNGTLRRTGKGL